MMKSKSDGERMEKQKDKIVPVDRQVYARRMAENLPVLRARLGLTQAGLAEMVGVTRQTISLVESGTRELPWSSFISLLYIFKQNEQTLPLLEVLQISTPEVESLFQVTTELGRLKK